jgi:hypothetical protein
MSGRHWLRRDVLLPVLYLAVFGVALYWLYGQLNTLPAASMSMMIVWLIRSVWIIYALLCLITMRHVLSTYDLERYDPGNLDSLKRLMKRRRYRLNKKHIPTEALLVQYESVLLSKGYRLETDKHEIGRIYARKRFISFLTRWKYERVIILQHEPLNVFMIDQILQDCIRYIRSQNKPSRRNLLLIVTRMQEAEEVASCGAGIVNFLGKFKGGTLGVLLLATEQFRLFYPADRTLQPLSHRLFQDRFRHRLERMIFHMQHAHRSGRSKKISSNEKPPYHRVS